MEGIMDKGHCDTCRWWGRERAHDDNMPRNRGV